MAIRQIRATPNGRLALMLDHVALDRRPLLPAFPLALQFDDAVATAGVA
jgi:hypothetical protein